MMGTDMDMIKEIPGYKVILKTVLKSQIQQLVEQLASYTDEESVILTASISDGTLSHLGSDSGKFFLVDHEDIKSQFLGFCLKRHHAKIAQEQHTPTPIGQPWKTYTGHDPGPNPGGIPNYRKKTSRHSVSSSVKGVRHEPYSMQRHDRRSFDSTIQSVAGNNSKIKEETEQSSHIGSLDTSYHGNGQNNQQYTTNQTNTSNDVNKDSDTIHTNVTVKKEPVPEPDTDLEITGVEFGGNTSGDLNTSQGYDPTQPLNTSQGYDAMHPLNTSQGFVPMQPLNTSQGHDQSQSVNVSKGYDSPGATGNLEDLQAQPSYEMDELVTSKFSVKGEDKSLNTAEDITDWKKSTCSTETPQELYFSMCDYKSINEPNLKRHVQIKQNDGYSSELLCGSCGKKFKSRYGLDLHFKSCHEETFKYECRMCQKKYNTLGNYKVHIASHDTALHEKCPNCPATFQYRSSMLRHQISCPNVKPEQTIVCTDCCAQFSSKDALKEHTRREHEKSVVTCNKCQKQFKWRSSLYYHQKKYH